MFEPVEHWHEFYVLLGTAAAALVALQFVAASLGAGFLSFEKAEASRIYMTPVIVHFTSVLYACAVGLVPTHTPLTFAIAIGVPAFAGVIYSGLLSVRVLQDGGDGVEFDDNVFHGIAPPLGYVIGVVSAVMFFQGAAHAAAVLALALLLLLVVNIRNAWDLTLYMARKQTEAHKTNP